MKIGVPKEIKIHEYRVGLVPGSVHELARSGHEVVVETLAGAGIGCSDDDYRAAGAVIMPSAKAVFDAAECVVKVKEPQLVECAMLRPGQILFTYLHLAADRPQTEALMRSGAHAIAYETVIARDGSLPLLTPMSEVAGRMSHRRRTRDCSGTGPCDRWRSGRGRGRRNRPRHARIGHHPRQIAASSS
jgi:alanine dehydrogenase